MYGKVCNAIGNAAAHPVCNSIGNLWGECGVYSIYLTPETLSYCIGTQAICQVKKLTINSLDNMYI